MFSTPPEYDPVAFHYLLQLETLLRRGGDLNADLLVRSRAAAVVSRDGDNSLGTTTRRVSWCCHTASHLFLLLLGVTTVEDVPKDRPLVTLSKLEEMDLAVQLVEKNVTVDRAEYAMGNPEVQRGAEQLWHANLQKVTRAAALMREMLGYAKTYTQGIRSAAGTVGGTFFYLLVELGESRDRLVELAEELVTVAV